MHQFLRFFIFLHWHSTCFGRSFRPSSGVQDCTYSNRHMASRYCYLLASEASKQVAVSACHMPVDVCAILNSWWWTERPSETCRVSMQKNKKSEKLVHLVGFTVEKQLTDRNCLLIGVCFGIHELDPPTFLRSFMTLDIAHGDVLGTHDISKRGFVTVST